MATKITHPIYGIWNVAGNCWIVTDSGHQFKTLDLDVALDVFNNLGGNGIEIKQLSLGEVETFEIKK